MGDKATARTVSRYGVAIALAGAFLQFALGAYYLAMAHSPAPHHLPIGLVASAADRQQLVGPLEHGGHFKVADYPTSEALVTAIKKREAYGGALIDGQTHTLYIASAGGPAVASLLKATYLAERQRQINLKLDALTKADTQVDPATTAYLASAPSIVDVVPLPAADSAGSSLGFLIQALALGGSIASVALGRLGRLTTRSLRRGFGHASLLVVYAVLSAGVAISAMQMFGVGKGASGLPLVTGLSLVSLSITASIAACVSLVGPAGTLLGGVYFSLGIIISGASIAPEMLPTAGKVAGQLLPPGAGSTLLRNALYFPAAPNTGPFIVLGLFAGIGLITVVLTNALRYERGGVHA